MRELVSLVTCGLVDHHGRQQQQQQQQPEVPSNRDHKKHNHTKINNIFHKKAGKASSDSSSNGSNQQASSLNPRIVPGSDYRIHDHDIYRSNTGVSTATDLQYYQHEDDDPDALNHPVTVDTTLSPEFGVAR